MLNENNLFNNFIENRIKEELQVKMVDLGINTALLRQNGTVSLYGTNLNDQNSLSDKRNKSITQVSLGSGSGGHTALLKVDGTVELFGSNLYGQCIMSYTQTQTISQVALGFGHSGVL